MINEFRTKQEYAKNLWFDRCSASIFEFHIAHRMIIMDHDYVAHTQFILYVVENRRHKTKRNDTKNKKHAIAVSQKLKSKKRIMLTITLLPWPSPPTCILFSACVFSFFVLAFPCCALLYFILGLLISYFVSFLTETKNIQIFLC